MATRCFARQAAVGWVERSETHQTLPAAVEVMGFAALYPSCELSLQLRSPNSPLSSRRERSPAGKFRDQRNGGRTTAPNRTRDRLAHAFHGIDVHIVDALPIQRRRTLTPPPHPGHA